MLKHSMSALLFLVSSAAYISGADQEKNKCAVFCTETVEGVTLGYEVSLCPDEVGHKKQIIQHIKTIRKFYLKLWVYNKIVSIASYNTLERTGNCRVKVTGFESNSSRRVPVKSITVDMLHNRTHVLQAVTTSILKEQ